jgi:hypothetical protein
MTTTNIDYFESDQIKFALVLWKVAKKARQPDFDVLKFSHQWVYADTVLQQLMLSDDPDTSQQAIDLMSLRILFAQKFPERAQKMGAVITGSGAGASTAKQDSRGPERSPDGSTSGQTPPQPNDKRYIKGVR